MNDFYYKKLDAYKIAKEFTIYVYSLIRKSLNDKISNNQE